MQVNLHCFRAFAKGKERLKCKLSEELHDEVFEGCPLISAITHRRQGLINGAMYSVVRWSQDSVTLRDVELDFELTMQQQELAHCRYGFACTYCSCQGKTLREHTRLCDVWHPRFSIRHLSMGLSRVVSASLIDLC